ncbi:hypothetical protein KKF91_03975 [Myxococcota bacterium]|nr:hypothetical protein [Myxococcota bacterium]MBU1429702.1 hypothetical protein [Myxococcota bacterium]MBU1899820.1 hypothetical protein [Myxococcota bacterium]
MNIHLVIVDPQRDFCDPHGALFVPGADEDMKRLARLIERLGGPSSPIVDIHVTMDSHQKVDISHPIWWRDAAGKPPAPFTLITGEAVRAGQWTTYQPSLFERSLAYLDALEAQGRYPHCIWPEHCLIGSEGHAVDPTLFAALQGWSERFATIDYVTKGSNPFTEHFSAVKAEVIDPEDPSTHINMGLVSTLEQADVVLFAGEALSHCVANTGRDIADAFSDPRYIQKIMLLTDASSNVTGFDQLGDAFVRDMRARGMKVSTCKDAIDQFR